MGNARCILAVLRKCQSVQQTKGCKFPHINCSIKYSSWFCSIPFNAILLCSMHSSLLHPPWLNAKSMPFLWTRFHSIQFLSMWFDSILFWFCFNPIRFQLIQFNSIPRCLMAPVTTACPDCPRQPGSADGSWCYGPGPLPQYRLHLEHRCWTGTSAESSASLAGFHGSIAFAVAEGEGEGQGASQSKSQGTCKSKGKG